MFIVVSLKIQSICFTSVLINYYIINYLITIEMKTLKRLKLNDVNLNELTQKDLKRVKAGAFCSSYNCSCGGTFSTSMTDAVLEDDSHR